jgi:hypothetical protein
MSILSRISKNSQFTWEKNLEVNGNWATYYGGRCESEEQYLASGQHEWNVIKRFMPNLDCVFEYGAGDGRLSVAAAIDCNVLHCYEPVDVSRKLLVDRMTLSGKDNVNCFDGRILDATDSKIYTSIFCWNVMHHMDYDDVYEFMDFCERNAADDCTILTGYTDFCPEGRIHFLVDKVGALCPFYIWTQEQIRTMFDCYGFRMNVTTRRGWRVIDTFVRYKDKLTYEKDS